MTASPLWQHQRVLANLLYYLTEFVKKHDLGYVCPAPLDVVFSTFDVVEPDILYISQTRASVVTEKNVQGAPIVVKSLVVEVLSESTAKIDRTTKLKLYARYGVAEYWVINPLTYAVEIYRLVTGGYELASQLDSSQSLTSPHSPALRFPSPGLRNSYRPQLCGASLAVRCAWRSAVWIIRSSPTWSRVSKPTSWPS